MKRSIMDRFEENIYYSIDGCHYWIGALGNSKQKHGANRGRFSLGGVNCMAYRVAYQLYKGPIPDELCVCHTCDNGYCVNPDHLFLGTRKDNIMDMVNKGRSCFGARHFKAILTEKDVLEIRATDMTNLTYRELGEKYGVNLATIEYARKGKSWKHLNRHTN